MMRWRSALKAPRPVVPMHSVATLKGVDGVDGVAVVDLMGPVVAKPSAVQRVPGQRFIIGRSERRLVDAIEDDSTDPTHFRGAGVNNGHGRPDPVGVGREACVEDEKGTLTVSQ